MSAHVLPIRPAAPPDGSVEVLAFTLVDRGALIGFCDVLIPALHLTIYGCGVFHGPRGPFVGLPQRPVLDREGRQRTDSASKKMFEPVIGWPRTVADRFSAAVLAEIDRRYPRLRLLP